MHTLFIGDNLILKKISEYKYIITYNKYIDFFNYKEVSKLIDKIIHKFFKIKGIYNINIYINYNETKILVDIEKTNINFIDVHLLIIINELVLYKIKTYELLKKIKHKKVYYYNSNYYIELTNNLKYKEILILEEISECVYGLETINIINKGVQLCEKM